MDIGSIGNRLEQHLPGLVGIGVFLEQITTGSAQSAIQSAPNATAAFEVLANAVSGKITGFNMFKNVTTFPQTFKLSGALNKWVGLSVLLYVYAELGLPGGPLARKISGTMFVGGLFGGFFDEYTKPVGQSLIAGRGGAYLQSPTGYYSPSLAASVAELRAYNATINATPGVLPRIPGA